MFGIDKAFLVYLIGMYSSYLLLNGKIAEACRGDVNVALSEALGSIMLLGSSAIFAWHQIHSKKIEASTPESEELTRQTRLNALAVIVKSALTSFMYKKPPVPPTEPPIVP